MEAVVADAGTSPKNANILVGDLYTNWNGDEAVAILEVRKPNHRLQEILNNPSIEPEIADRRATLESAENGLKCVGARGFSRS